MRIDQGYSIGTAGNPPFSVKDSYIDELLKQKFKTIEQLCNTYYECKDTSREKEHIYTKEYLLWMRIDQGYSIGTAGNPPFLIGETPDGSQS